MQRAGDVLASVLKPMPTAGEWIAHEADDQRRIEAYAQWLMVAIACPQMRMSPCLKIARGVVCHRKGPDIHRQVQEILAMLDKATHRRSQYANAGFNRLRREYQLEDV